jgi:hypothetical protein
MKQLTKAILKVMAQVKNIEKNMKVGSGSYAYNGVKDFDVKVSFNEAMTKAGLTCIPIDIQEETQVDRWQENGRTKQQIFCKVKTKYLLLHESGESIEIVGYGHGTDNQDKASGKAQTYALKNALLYTFLTPVGKLEDTDNVHSDTHEIPRPNFNDALPEMPTIRKRKKVENIEQLEKIVSWCLEKDKSLIDVKSHYELTKTQEKLIIQKLTEDL